MDYARVDETGQVLEVGPEPDVFELPDGSTVVTPVGVPTAPEVLAEAGWVPVEDAPVGEPEGRGPAGADLVFDAEAGKVIRFARFELEPEVKDPLVEVVEQLREQAIADVGVRHQLTLRLEAAVADHAELMGRVDDLAARVKASQAPAIVKLVTDLRAELVQMRRAR